MAGTPNSTRKRKTFPDLGAPAPEPVPPRPASSLNEEVSDDDSDAPEAVTLTGGRALEEAKAGAIKAHQQRLQEKRKAQNKSREAFIRSTKSKASLAPGIGEAGQGHEETTGNDGSTDGGESGNEAQGGDPVLQARMAKAMQDAQEEDEGVPGNEDLEEPMPAAASSARLPDSIFAAAAIAHQGTERKRKPTTRERDAKAKRRRVRDGPSERVVGGRTLRVTTAVDAPPPLPSISARKANNTVKGGRAFRRKWKKRDALQAQIRSRNGPAINFATAVQ